MNLYICLMYIACLFFPLTIIRFHLFNTNISSAFCLFSCYMRSCNSLLKWYASYYVGIFLTILIIIYPITNLLFEVPLSFRGSKSHHWASISFLAHETQNSPTVHVLQYVFPIHMSTDEWETCKSYECFLSLLFWGEKKIMLCPLRSRVLQSSFAWH